MTRWISIFLAVLVFQLLPVLAMAHDAEERGHHSLGQENRRERRVHSDHFELEAEEGEKGNEVTGQAAAWLFVLANLKVAISIFAKFVNRFFGSESQVRSSVIGLSRFLNNHLGKLHYILNPIALVIAFLHFLLSSCRSTSLPEWGLLLVATMALLGLTLRLKVPFIWMRKVAYRVHTGSVTFLVVLIVLAGGHLMID